MSELTIAEKLQAINDNMDAVYEAGVEVGVEQGKQIGIEQGKQAQYDAFWDIFQQEGDRTSYVYGFGGRGWTKENFVPKYDMQISNANSMFAYCAVTGDLVELLNDLGVNLDFTNCTLMNMAFQNSYFSRLGHINAITATNLTQCFMNMSNLVTIDKLTVTNKCTTFSAIFTGTPALKNITLEGQIAANISFAPCTKLTKASITSIINALSSTTSGLKLTLSKIAVGDAFETSEGAEDGSDSTEWATLTATKTNWTISLS